MAENNKPQDAKQFASQAQVGNAVKDNARASAEAVQQGGRATADALRQNAEVGADVARRGTGA